MDGSTPNDTCTYPDDKRSIHNSWSKQMENFKDSADVAVRTNYFKPLWRWMHHIQNDFAARADWCVADYKSANHHPIVSVKGNIKDMNVNRGQEIILDASTCIDPDGDNLSFNWYRYSEADLYDGDFSPKTTNPIFQIKIPDDIKSGQTIHLICEVSDNGTPALTRYIRIILTIR